jgi:hypothetical protein
MQDSPDRKPAQPWHAADEAPAKDQPGGSAPVGTHSLTGGGAEVGMPQPAGGRAERGRAKDEARPAEVDPLAEPRADTGAILGRKP